MHFMNTTNLATNVPRTIANTGNATSVEDLAQSNLEQIERMGEFVNRNGLGITISIFAIILITIYFHNMTKESQAEREADRALRQKDHDERVKMNEIRMQREDANTAFLQTAIEKITEAMTRSSLTSERVEQVLVGTAQMHVILDEKVDNIEVKLDSMITDVAKMKSNVQKLKEENEEFMKLLSTLENVERGLLRMEKSLGDVMVTIAGIEEAEEIKSTKGVKGK